MQTKKTYENKNKAIEQKFRKKMKDTGIPRSVD